MRSLPGWLEPITLPMPATLGAVNAYVVRGPRGVGLVDTGMDDVNSRAELEAGLDRLGLAMGDIDIVVGTHYHPDHCGLGRTLQLAGARVLMSEQDAESLAMFFAHPEADRERATFHGKHEVPEQFAQRVTTMFPFFRSLQERFEPDGFLSDGEVVDMGGVELEVIHTPGHTRGHVCLARRDDKVVLTGDHLIPGEATHVSMREEAQGTDPLGRFLESLERVGELDGFTGCGGHGAPMGDVSERADQVIRHHRARIERVRGVLGDRPRTAYDLALEAMGPRNKVFARWLAMSQTLGYLEHLVALGRAIQVEQPGTIAFRAAAADG